MSNQLFFFPQERFLSSGTTDPDDETEYTWWIPITYTSKTVPNQDTYPTEWIKPNEQLDITGLPTAENWVIFNVHETGYYRVNYDSDNWAAIIQQMEDDHTTIDVKNRAQLLDDSFNLALAGLIYHIMYMRIFYFFKY